MTESLLRIHNAGDFTLKGGYRIDHRVIPDYQIVFFPAGAGTRYSVSDTDSILMGPSAIITRPGEPHSYQFVTNQPTRHLFAHFEFNSTSIAARYPLLTLSHKPPILALPPSSLISQNLTQLFIQMHLELPRWKMHVEIFLLAVLEELESMMLGSSSVDYGRDSLPAPLAQALHIMNTNLQQPIPIEQVAQLVGWSHEHFTRMFNKYLGLSPKEWLIKRRIELGAKHLLRRTDTVKRIAHSIGFSDEYYFHRLFRRHMGMSAIEYRKRYGDPRLHELVTFDDEAQLYPVNHYFTNHYKS